MEDIQPVATFEGKLDKPLYWHGDTLVITYGLAKPFKQAKSFNGIAVRYVRDRS